MGLVLNERPHLRQARVIAEEPDTAIAWLSDPNARPVQLAPPEERLALGTPPETSATPILAPPVPLNPPVPAPRPARCGQVGVAVAVLLLLCGFSAW